MGDQIVNDKIRSQRNPPVIIDIVAAGTASPAGFGIFNADAVHFTTQFLGRADRTFVEFFASFFFDKIFDPAVEKVRFSRYV